MILGIPLHDHGSWTAGAGSGRNPFGRHKG